MINLADAPAIGAPRGATFIRLEPDGVTWPDTGVNVQVMQPGQPNGRYHSEPLQEDFLVVYGECMAIVDGDERVLRQWDFLHCPAGSEHVFVGAGHEPCAVLMIGSRREDACHYTSTIRLLRMARRCRKKPMTRRRLTPTGAQNGRTPQSRTRGRLGSPHGPAAASAYRSNPIVDVGARSRQALRPVAFGTRPRPASRCLPGPGSPVRSGGCRPRSCASCIPRSASPALPPIRCRSSSTSPRAGRYR